MIENLLAEINVDLELKGDEAIMFALENFAEEIIIHSSKCQNCTFCHGRMCYFASECLTHDFQYFRPLV